MTSKQVAEKFIDFDWSDDITKEQKEMIYSMDNVSIEINKGKKMSIKIFNEEHMLCLTTIKGIEELRDLLSTIISKKIEL